MSIVNGFRALMVKIGIKRAKKKSSILKELIDNPENVKLEVYIEGEELILKVKRKEIES